jgi:hypothetical protein
MLGCHVMEENDSNYSGAGARNINISYEEHHKSI